MSRKASRKVLGTSEGGGVGGGDCKRTVVRERWKVKGERHGRRGGTISQGRADYAKWAKGKRSRHCGKLCPR